MIQAVILMVDAIKFMSDPFPETHRKPTQLATLDEKLFKALTKVKELDPSLQYLKEVITERGHCRTLKDEATVHSSKPPSIGSSVIRYG